MGRWAPPRRAFLMRVVSAGCAGRAASCIMQRHGWPAGGCNGGSVQRHKACPCSQRRAPVAACTTWTYMAWAGAGCQRRLLLIYRKGLFPCARKTAWASCCRCTSICLSHRCHRTWIALVVVPVITTLSQASRGSSSISTDFLPCSLCPPRQAVDMQRFGGLLHSFLRPQFLDRGFLDRAAERCVCTHTDT